MTTGEGAGGSGRRSGLPPFLHLREWLREGPGGERLLAGTVGLLLVALIGWASAPFGGGSVVLAGSEPAPSSGSVPAASSVGSGGAAAGVAGGAAPATGRSAVPRGTLTTGSPLGGSAGGPVGTGPSQVLPGAAGPRSACGTPGRTDHGVTATTITIGVVLVDLGSANAILDLPSAADQQKSYSVVFDDANRRGGVLCRRLVPKFYPVNPLDSSAEHAACLQMAQDKVFAVFNNLYNSTEQTCVAKAGIPNIWYQPPHTPDVRKYAPFIMSWNPDFDTLIHQYVFGAKGQGFFAGMKKLGILEGSCYPDEIAALLKELKAAGIDASKAERFNYGCTGAPALQADQQAVLQFQRAGVTHILNVAFTYDATFSRAADQQGYRPRFAHMEDSSATSIESGNQKPGDSFDGTLLISTLETGAGNTPGYRYNKATQECDRLLAGAGLPSAHSTPGASVLGIGCIDVKLFKAAAEHAPSLTRRSLSTGLARAGPMELAFPAGPVHVTDPSLPTSGQFWRPGKWVTACQCWRVTDARYRSTY